MSDIFLGQLSDTPVGDLLLAASDRGLVAVEWADSRPGLDRYLGRFGRRVVPAQAALEPYAAQLAEYLDGRRRELTFPIDWASLRPFQRQVLERVFAIPCGETRTYREIAVRIGRPRAARAVGRANATNPMPLAVPCHRLIGSDGKLHGYGGGQGLATKEWLLQMEGALIP